VLALYDLSTLTVTMSKHKLPVPFHMSEVDSDVPILPGGTDASSEDQPEGATFVDIGSLQTDPKIS
jgi:hypothetical protein